MQIQLHHMHIFASDMEATLGFWQDMFGAKVLFDTEIAGARNVMIAIGSGRMNIYDQPPREGRGGAFHHIGIQTDDLDALTEHMKGKGFRFQRRIREHHYLRYIMAMAPDNILVELFQVLPESASPEGQKPLKRAFTFDDID
ncbi:MAG: VOC family protein [Dehalococcoidia bacterium]|nr:VOC family protein [Dehalococcoidia bacterium]